MRGQVTGALLIFRQNQGIGFTRSSACEPCLRRGRPGQLLHGPHRMSANDR